MSMIRWEPFGAVDDVFARMPSLLGRWPRAFDANGEKPFDWAPSIDISETDTEYLLRAELPATKKEDVRITFDDGTLTISGERKQKTEEKNGKGAPRRELLRQVLAQLPASGQRGFRGHSR